MVIPFPPMEPPMGMPFPPMGPPLRMPFPKIEPFSFGMPSQTIQTPENTPPHILEYNTNGFKLLPAVSPQNPINYKELVGEFINEYVEKIAGEALGPQTKGMLIDLLIPEIQGYLTDYNELT